MKRIANIFALGLLFCILQSYAQSNNFRIMSENEKKLFIQHMQTASQTLQSLRCNFIQQKEMSILAEASVSKGMMYFKAPDALRWEYTSPQTYAFIMYQGQSVLKNDKGTTAMDAQSSKMIKNMTEMIMGMINGKGLMDNKNFSTDYSVNPTQTLITLIPKNSRIKMLFSSIYVYVDSKTFLAHKIIMNEKGGDSTTITFSETQKNVAIPAETFHLK